MIATAEGELQVESEAEAVQALCEASLYDFVKEFWPFVEPADYIDNWHIGAICEHLQAVTAGQIPKLLINIPPGCSKSLLVCVFWPAWEWAKDPSIRWFFASYDQRLSTRDSVRCRALLSCEPYREIWGDKFKLVLDQNQKTYYETDKKGYRMATSVGGHGTGEHPDRICVDDANNVKQAESELERQSTLDWWDLTMGTRGISRNARRVIIMQRLHEEDLSGHVLAEGDWTHICLPMRYELGRMPDTQLGWNDPRKAESELLAPEQFDEAKVIQQEKVLGKYGTAGQLQQRPVPKEGGMFKETFFQQTVRAAPYQAIRIRYWDRAATENAGNWTCGTLIAMPEDGNFYVENVVRGQWEPDERDDNILATARRDKARYGPDNEPIIYIEKEPGSAGVDAYKYTAKKLAGFKVMADRPTGSKEIRAEPWASQCAAKNVFLVADGSWDMDEWIKEHCGFPFGRFNDQVDSASGAFGRLADRRGTVQGVRVLRSNGILNGKKNELRIVACGLKELSETLEIHDHKCLLVSISDPLLSVDPGIHPEMPTHRLDKLLDWLPLSFADMQPADHQAAWGDPVPPWNRAASTLVMAPADGKRLWAFLLKKRDPPAELWVIQDSGGEDRRALSVALALADMLHIQREKAIYRPAVEGWKATKETTPGNAHVFAVVKSSRSMVV